MGQPRLQGLGFLSEERSAFFGPDYVQEECREMVATAAFNGHSCLAPLVTNCLILGIEKLSERRDEPKEPQQHMLHEDPPSPAEVTLAADLFRMYRRFHMILNKI